MNRPQVIRYVIVIIIIILIGIVIHLIIKRTSSSVTPKNDKDYPEEGTGVVGEVIPIDVDKDTPTIDDPPAPIEWWSRPKDIAPPGNFFDENGILIATIGGIVAASLFTTMLIKIGPRIRASVLKLTGKALTKIGEKTGAKGLIKIGAVSSKKAAKITGEIAAKKAGKAAGQVAAKAATRTIAGIGSKVGLGPVGAVLLPFEISSIALDIIDATGQGQAFSQMGTRQTYYELKNQIDSDAKKTYDESEVDYPVIVGPLSNLDEEELQSLIKDDIEQMFKNPNNKYLKPIIDKLKASNLRSDAEISTFLDRELALIDYDKMVTEVLNSVCVSKGGKVVTSGSSNPQCSYPTRERCLNSYRWPIEGTEDIYAEWNLKNNACTLSSSAMRAVCATNGLDYDPDKGICRIDEKYCKSKGAEWEYNDKIKEYDCVIPPSQEAAEVIFGTVYTRMGKQIADGPPSIHPGWLEVKDRKSGESNVQWLNRITRKIFTAPSGVSVPQFTVTDQPDLVVEKREATLKDGGKYSITTWRNRATGQIVRNTVAPFEVVAGVGGGIPGEIATQQSWITISKRRSGESDLKWTERIVVGMLGGYPSPLDYNITMALPSETIDGVKLTSLVSGINELSASTANKFAKWACAKFYNAKAREIERQRIETAGLIDCTTNTLKGFVY